MKIEKKQKELIILGVLVLAIVAVLGSYFLKRMQPAPNVAIGDDTGNPFPAGVGVETLPGTSQYNFLPEGFDVDLGVLEDERFRVLVPPSYPNVERGEIGNSDPFVK